MDIKIKNKKLYLVGPIVAVVATAVILTITLFVSPYVGMEDNGDFSRVIYNEGLFDLQENSELLYNGYFIKEYGIINYYNEYSHTVYTSQFLFIQPAIWLDKLFTGNDDVFDLRFLGFVMMIYFLIVLYFFADYLTHKLSLVSSLIITASCIFVFADTGYIAYLNSFYAEPVAYVSLMACITCALLYADGRYNKYTVLAGFVINGAILTFSKQQFAPIGALLSIMGLLFYLKAQGRLFKWLIAISSAALLLAGIFNYLLISAEFTNINMFHSMTRGALMTSDNPPETLESFGIDDQYELLNKNIYFDRYPVIHSEDDMLQENFYSKYNIFSIMKYYVQNPNSFFEMLKFGALNAYRIRPEIGTYEYSAGYPPNTLAQTFSLYSNAKSNYTPKTTGFIIIWTILGLALLYKKRMKQMIILGLIIIGYSQIVVSIIGAGDADFAKHVFLYNVAYDMVNVILLAHVISFFDRKYKDKRYKKAQILEDIDDALYKNI